MARIRPQFLFALVLLDLAWTFRLRTKGRTEVEDVRKDKFELEDRTILEQFYDYVRRERDDLERRMGSEIFDLGNVVMKVPNGKSRNKRSKETVQKSNEYNLGKIKEELIKLQDLITILKDQQNVITLLDSVDNSKGSNLNFTSISKELNDFKRYIKTSVVEKLEKEIEERKVTDDNLLTELKNQKDTLENIIKNNGGNQKDAITSIVQELENLQTHLKDIINKAPDKEDPILKSQEKTNPNFLKQLLKLIETTNKTTKPDKIENRELDLDDENQSFEDRLKFLKDEIERETSQTRDLKETLKNILKPVEANPTNLEGILKRLTTQNKFNLYNCKQVQTASDEAPFKYLNPIENYYPPPNNYGYVYNQQDQNQLFQDPYQAYFNQQRSNGQYPQEYQVNTWQNYNDNYAKSIADMKNQILNIQNIIGDLTNSGYNQKAEGQNDLHYLNQEINGLKNDVNNLEQNRDGDYSYQNKNDHHQIKNSNKIRAGKNEDGNRKTTKHIIKRSSTKDLEQILLDIIKDENELDSSREETNDKERSYYNSQKTSTSKKDTIFDKILDKILNKIVDKIRIATPKILTAIFDVKSIFGLDLNSYGLDFENVGLAGFLPVFILKLAAMFSSFVYQLQQYPFIKNFLIPALIVLGVSGLTVFLTWWLQPNNNYYYKGIPYQQNQKPQHSNLNGYHGFPNYQPSTNKFPPNMYNYNTNLYNSNYRNSRINGEFYNAKRNK